ncbi:ARF-GAP domain 6 protein [Prunus dulcis]|uniref:ARF-GAP domain 6 protein n=1 Tax=Prunus dulcis TaxID=3755 RepID=A0A5H2XQX8_PRUDU|nr:ARF-GAP domain 6 protein [Prunus dulcis]
MYGIGKLSLVAASAAQSAANVVQAGTKELTTKVKEGGYDYKVNETVNVVTAKTTEIGHRTWGIMKGVMAMASQKVEEYTKDGTTWKADNNWQRNDSEQNGYYQEFKQENKQWNSSGGGNHRVGILILTARVLGMIGTKKTIGSKRLLRERDPIAVTVGLAGMMAKTMDLIITRVHLFRRLLVTMGNRIQCGLGEALTKIPYNNLKR